MSIPLYIFLIIYLGAVIFYILASFVTLYHIFRFGFWDSSTKFMLAIHFTATAVILIFTGLLLTQTDWTQEVVLFQDIELRLNVE